MRPAGPNWWSMPPAASSSAERIDHVFITLMLLCVLITLLVAGLLTWFGVRYRAGSTAHRGGPAPRVTRTEVAWLTATLVVFLGMFAWAAVVFTEAKTPPAGARTIHVVGKQWMWRLDHASGRREINELHVPVGEPVRLILTSEDVIHSFFVPAFRMKQDAVPNRYTTMWFRPTRPGVYRLYCAEYCGAEHSRMDGFVYVLEPADFQRWLSDEAGRDPVPGTPGTDSAPLVRGRSLFHSLGCNVCHLRRGSVVAPRLDGIFGREIKLDTGRLLTADDAYLRESILEPNAKIAAGYASPSLMPSFRGLLSEQELEELVTYIRAIRHGWDGADPEEQP